MADSQGNIIAQSLARAGDQRGAARTALFRLLRVVTTHVCLGLEARFCAAPGPCAYWSGTPRSP
ncbi:MAG: hypothetical protein AAF640_04190 [Pseudomonadota bacterium]